MTTIGAKCFIRALISAYEMKNILLEIEQRSLRTEVASDQKSIQSKLRYKKDVYWRR
jgi:hypothetical protein